VTVRRPSSSAPLAWLRRAPQQPSREPPATAFDRRPRDAERPARAAARSEDEAAQHDDDGDADAHADLPAGRQAVVV
jgi:hypothetical protein